MAETRIQDCVQNVQNLCNEYIILRKNIDICITDGYYMTKIISNDIDRKSISEKYLNYYNQIIIYTNCFQTIKNDVNRFIKTEQSVTQCSYKSSFKSICCSNNVKIESIIEFTGVLILMTPTKFNELIGFIPEVEIQPPISLKHSLPMDEEQPNKKQRT